MYDPSVLNSDDGDEPIVVGNARRKNLSVYFVFEDHDATIFRRMHDKGVAAVAEFEQCVIGDGVEIVLAVNESP